MPLKASDIAALLNTELQGADITIERAATLDSASANSVVFLKKNDPALIAKIAAHEAILAILPAGAQVEGISSIAVDHPRLAFARVLEKFFAKPQPAQLIATSAIIDPTATLGKGVRVGHYSVIGPNAVIGDNTEIRSQVVIAQGVRIGRDCLIKSGAVIGEEGFGIAKDEQQNNLRVPHIGSVVIGDRVEIGALNTVACGTVDTTIIGDGCKFDDHVHVAHNVVMGTNCIITACAEISGSVTLGNDVWLGPNCSIINSITIGDGALIGIGAVISKPVPAGAVMGAARATRLQKDPA